MVVPQLSVDMFRSIGFALRSFKQVIILHLTIGMEWPISIDDTEE